MKTHFQTPKKMRQVSLSSWRQLRPAQKRRLRKSERRAVRRELYEYLKGIKPCVHKMSEPPRTYEAKMVIPYGWDQDRGTLVIKVFSNQSHQPQSLVLI